MKESYDIMNILSIEDAKKFVSGGKVVIVTGVTGQDGSFMVDYLLRNTPYIIFGGARRLSVANHENIDHLDKEKRFHLINFDLTDAHSIAQTISQLKPSYFINFAAQSFVKSSWDFPAQTWETNSTSIIHILESIRLHCPSCRFYNAGSSEEFGNVIYSPQDEKHPLRPRSPYGASKASARQIVKVYRDSYNLYVIQGWLFNHEGTRRGEEFVTRKITKGVVRIANELSYGQIPIVPIELGNIYASRDWSDAEDCIDAVWRMLNQEIYNKNFTTYRPFPSTELKEYVVGSGNAHTIKEFVDEAFKEVGRQGVWEFHGLDERYRYNDGCGNDHILVKINPTFYRPAEVENLLANPTAIMNELDWKPQTSFKELVRKMVRKDLDY